jgi:hypothetical protein
MGEWTLRRQGGFPGMPGPVVVCVMDGVGIGRRDESDAVWLARTPTLDRLAREVPTGQLLAHGRAVGMPSDDDMGNSEVGHNAIGAGRIFDQGAKLVARAIADGSIFEGEKAGTWQAVTERVRARGARRSICSGCSPTATSTATSNTSSPSCAARTSRRSSASASTSCSTAATSRRRAPSTTSTPSRSCSRRSRASPAATIGSPPVAGA